jgi:hypothetical protein
MPSKLERRVSRGAAAALALLLGACAAATRPPGAGRPGAAEPPKFVALAASDERRAAALANWKTILGDQAAASPVPELQPVTATLKALPANLPAPPRMPLVVLGDKKAQTEEETRESLRRFIASAVPLLGVTPQELSLVEVRDAAGGAKTARYQQNPFFQYPLRNGYGVVEVSFTPDLRVVGLSSTAIPDSEQLRRSLAAVKPAVDAAHAAAALTNRAVTFTDRNGVRQTRTVTQADAAAARELVVFPVPRPDGAALELHVAWEVAVGGPEAPPLAYVDAVTGDVLAATQ